MNDLEAMTKIHEELKKFLGIITSKRFKVASIITRDDDKIILFFIIVDDEKEKWIKAVLNGEI